jgi:hypothetical protein
MIVASVLKQHVFKYVLGILIGHHLQKLIVTQLVKKLPAFNET